MKSILFDLHATPINCVAEFIHHTSKSAARLLAKMANYIMLTFTSHPLDHKEKHLDFSALEVRE